VLLLFRRKILQQFRHCLIEVLVVFFLIRAGIEGFRSIPGPHQQRSILDQVSLRGKAVFFGIFGIFRSIAPHCILVFAVHDVCLFIAMTTSLTHFEIYGEQPGQSRA
jgi:hypothetical protein